MATELAETSGYSGSGMTMLKTPRNNTGWPLVTPGHGNRPPAGVLDQSPMTLRQAGLSFFLFCLRQATILSSSGM